MSNRRKTSSTTDINNNNNNNNEVDQLLQAAQDEVLLKLSTDSHMTRVAPDYLDSDLDRRFQALKSRPSTKPQPKQQQQPPPQKPKLPNSLDVNNVVVDDELKAVLGDDHLSARFAALKATFPSSSSSTETHVGPKITDAQDNGKEVFDHEDEVEKLIKWAIDAARLDPSPPSDEEHGDDEDDHSDDDDDDKDSDDDDDDRVVHRKRDNRKK